MVKYFVIGIICTILAQTNLSSNSHSETEQQDTYLACSGCK